LAYRVIIEDIIMDKILSTRVDESIIHQLNLMTDVLSTTKKAVLEKAIVTLMKQVEHEKNITVLDITFGAWQRKESVEETVQHGRETFQKSMVRHQK
jgi:ubiquinone/menaquinone biosynthesis C-methylase UbiE